MALSNLIAQREALGREQAELTKAIGEAQIHAHSEVIARIKQLMAEHGLVAADLTELGTPQAGPRALAGGCARTF